MTGRQAKTEKKRGPSCTGRMKRHTSELDLEQDGVLAHEAQKKPHLEFFVAPVFCVAVPKRCFSLPHRCFLLPGVLCCQRSRLAECMASAAPSVRLRRVLHVTERLRSRLVVAREDASKENAGAMRSANTERYCQITVKRRAALQRSAMNGGITCKRVCGC